MRTLAIESLIQERAALRNGLRAVEQELYALKKLMWSAPHSVYCGDIKERIRLNKLGAKIPPCARCKFEKLYKSTEG